MDDLKLVEPDKEKLDEIFSELEFKSFANRILKKPQQKKIKPTGELDLFGAQQDDGQEVQKTRVLRPLKALLISIN